MNRRTLLTAGTVIAAGTAASPALASEKKGGSTEAAALNIAGLGLPIIAGGRIRNYVFVTLRLTLGGGATPEQMRAKEPFFRDALVKAAHRTPFVVATDWTVVNAAAVCASVMRMAPGIAGAGKVARAEVLIQTPRRRTGVTPV
ncbi:hypothetical protein [Brevundimonas variabilis]|uniref:Tat pathway signal protein n=1 Tax=Brevundimonas variabilis TaxID=74312 RepID=A0A7W9CHC4_9CAUL|nr:hypothetical protein [Brevundimonas variabilis]MBB5745506.1 hypothetical protein [Brevundimonas variabilis]